MVAALASGRDADLTFGSLLVGEDLSTGLLVSASH